MDQTFLMNVIPFVAIFAIMYFFLIRPQQKRVKDLRTMVDNVKRGDIVVTAGGIIGKVAKVGDEGEVTVEIADKVQVRVIKATISEVRVKGQAETKE
jgi:preprotein translocase subunit YajC